MTLHIAVLIGLGGTFQRAMLEGMQRYIMGKSWVFHIAPPQKEFLATVAEWQPDGAIGHISSSAPGRELKRSGVPFVDLLWNEDNEAPPATSVMVDDMGIGQLAAEHLLELGFKHFGFFGPVATAHRLRRERGFRAALGQAGRELHSYMLPSDTPPWHSWNDFDREVTEWLTSLPKPVAVLAGHDGAGRELSMICRKMGLRIPADVALLGIGNDELPCRWVSPPLSSIALPGERVGFEAAAMLDRLLAGEPPPAQATFLPPLRVVSRASTDMVFTDNSDVSAAIHFIGEHAHERIVVRDVLEHVAVHRRQLEQQFRRVLGRTLHQEIIRVRVKMAKQLLHQTDLPMQTVAERCGFDSARRLGTNFRNQAGITPSAFRRQSRLR